LLMPTRLHVNSVKVARLKMKGEGPTPSCQNPAQASLQGYKGHLGYLREALFQNRCVNLTCKVKGAGSKPEASRSKGADPRSMVRGSKVRGLRQGMMVQGRRVHTHTANAQTQFMQARTRPAHGHSKAHFPSRALFSAFVSSASPCNTLRNHAATIVLWRATPPAR